MKRLLAAICLLALPASAGEWALIDSSGVVKQVIEADYATTQDRDDGPWVKTFYRVGIDWSCDYCDGTDFIPPAVSSAPVISSGTVTGGNEP